MAVLAVQDITRAGVILTYPAAAVGGDQFLPGESTGIIVFNGSGSTITVTVATPGDVIGLGIADVSVSVLTGTTKGIGPFPAAYFANPTDGLVYVTYSAVTSVTLAVFRLAQP